MPNAELRRGVGNEEVEGWRYRISSAFLPPPCSDPVLSNSGGLKMGESVRRNTFSVIPALRLRMAWERLLWEEPRTRRMAFQSQ